MASKDTRTHRHSSGQIGPYKRLHTLGSGGFGEVWLGEHIHLHTKAAVKVLHAQWVNEMAEKFKHEAQLVAQLPHHRHVVRVLDFNIEKGRPFIVMDYAPGGNLRQRHTFGEKVPLRAVVSYARQIASGLQHAHNANVVHCDVKPENMFVGSKGEILIGDFGIAVGLQEENPQSEDTFGTAPYMAPEQILGGPQPESDQYALGVVIYEWLTGQPPFIGADKDEITLKHLFEYPQSLRAINPTIPVAVERVVMKALAKDPDQRYASIEEFAQELAAAYRPGSAAPKQHFPIGVQSSVRQPSHPPRLPQRRTSRRGWWPLFGGLLLALLGILAAIYVLSNVLSPVATVIITETGLSQTKDYSVSSKIGSRDVVQNPVAAHRETKVTAPQKNTVPATGMQHVVATQAHGRVTFYNWDSVPHDVPAGTIIAVPNSTLEVETDEAVKIPVGELPEAGVASARAHIVQAGTDGNIAAGTLYRTVCCSSDAVQVNNLNAFSGGLDDHIYTIVQQSDIDDAARRLETLEAQSGLALLQKLVTRYNILVVPSVHCVPAVTSDANVGSRATSVTDTVVSTCSGVFYEDDMVAALVQPRFIAYEDQRLGSAYSLTSSVRISVTHAQTSQDMLVLHIVATGIWHFNFNALQKQRLLLAITGKGKNEARTQLVQLISKKGVDTITVQFTWNVPGFTGDTLPSDIHRISLEIVQK